MVNRALGKNALRDMLERYIGAKSYRIINAILKNVDLNWKYGDPLTKKLILMRQENVTVLKHST